VITAAVEQNIVISNGEWIGKFHKSALVQLCKNKQIDRTSRYQ